MGTSGSVSLRGGGALLRSAEYGVQPRTSTEYMMLHAALLRAVPPDDCIIYYCPQ